MDKIEIPISRKKSILMLLGSLLFVAAGIWFVISPSSFSGKYDPVFILALGVLIVLFFGLGVFVSVRLLLQKKGGLTIDDTGIICDFGKNPVGFVPWEDIVDIEDYYVSGQSIIMIIVNNPQKYIDKNKNAFLRRMAEMNYKLYGTPVQLSANILKCDFAELYNLLKVELEENRVQIGRIYPHYLNNYVDETKRRIEE
jgi:hypothetical protein